MADPALNLKSTGSSDEQSLQMPAGRSCSSGGCPELFPTTFSTPMLQGFSMADIPAYASLTHVHLPREYVKFSNASVIKTFVQSRS